MLISSCRGAVRDRGQGAAGIPQAGRAGPSSPSHPTAPTKEQGN